MDFVVATESALRPRAYFNFRTLAHYLKREVRIDRQVFQLRLVGMLSAQRFTTRFVYARCCQIFYSHFKPSRSDNLAKRFSVKHYLLYVPSACLTLLGCRLLANYLLASLLIFINGCEELKILLILFSPETVWFSGIRTDPVYRYYFLYHLITDV